MFDGLDIQRRRSPDLATPMRFTTHTDGMSHIEAPPEANAKWSLVAPWVSG